jgi:hypothetical protein
LRPFARWILSLGLALLSAAAAAAEPTPTPQELKQVLAGHFAAGDRGDVRGAIGWVHTQSPIYLATKQAIESLVANFRFRSRVLDFSFIALSGDFAIARAKQEMRKVSGPAYRDHVLDSIYVFRREAGHWRIWQQAVLDMRFLEPTLPAP